MYSPMLTHHIWFSLLCFPVKVGISEEARHRDQDSEEYGHITRLHVAKRAAVRVVWHTLLRACHGTPVVALHILA